MGIGTRRLDALKAASKKAEHWPRATTWDTVQPKQPINTLTSNWHFIAMASHHPNSRLGFHRSVKQSLLMGFSLLSRYWALLLSCFFPLPSALTVLVPTERCMAPGPVSRLSKRLGSPDHMPRHVGDEQKHLISLKVCTPPHWQCMQNSVCL